MVLLPFTEVGRGLVGGNIECFMGLWKFKCVLEETIPSRVECIDFSIYCFPASNHFSHWFCVIANDLEDNRMTILPDDSVLECQWIK